WALVAARVDQPCAGRDRGVGRGTLVLADIPVVGARRSREAGGRAKNQGEDGAAEHEGLMGKSDRPASYGRLRPAATLNVLCFADFIDSSPKAAARAHSGDVGRGRGAR